MAVEADFAKVSGAGYGSARHIQSVFANPDHQVTLNGIFGEDQIKNFREKFPDEHKALTSAIHEEAEKAGKDLAPKAKTGAPWGWITASSLIGGATVGLVVWALMHQHDKKLLAKINQANTQG